MDHNHPDNGDETLTASVTTKAKPARDRICRYIRDCRGLPAREPGKLHDNYRAGRLFEVGILADGALHNPNGYPEAVVRRSLDETIARRHAADSEAAKKAAVTRARRREKKIHLLATSIATKSGVKPGTHCYVCGKSLTDAESIARGIGPECWQEVLQEVEWRGAMSTALPPDRDDYGDFEDYAPAQSRWMMAVADAGIPRQIMMAATEALERSGRPATVAAVVAEGRQRLAIQQANSAARTVTSGRRPGTPPAERKRQQRQREALLFERDDWRLFIEPATLPQKAGCQPSNLRQIVLREIVDNALDAGADATIERDGEAWIIADNGPGLDPADVPRLFAVNRPLLSSKRRRMPLRGMLGNGLRVVMGAVAASEGSIIIETRGHRLTLATDTATGTTQVVTDEAITPTWGLSVSITLGEALPRHNWHDDQLARTALSVAAHGKNYNGPSSPWWYSARDLHMLMQQVSPADTTVRRLCAELGFKLDDDRTTRSLDRGDAEAVLHRLRQLAPPITPKALGAIGPGLYGDDESYACHASVAPHSGAEIPYVCEVWASCERPEKRGNGSASVYRLLLNRTPSVAELYADSSPDCLSLRGCCIHRDIRGPKTGDYCVAISIITPYVELASDGKAPALHPFSEGITIAMKKACMAAWRAMEKPPGGMSIKEAAWQVMPAAYAAASGGVGLANARQVMYAAREPILKLTGKDELDDQYFIQTLLPDYIDEHPIATADWDVVFDDRGSFIEPHTGRIVPLGTVEVRQYYGERPPDRPASSINAGLMASTAGPTNRYLHILFIEKEGFSALLARARIAERFDVAIMSTKGMSVTAARWLLDRLAPHIKSVLVLHDFDMSGFSIFGTLTKSGRRYRFDNDVPIVDLGLRLDDISDLGLGDQAEPVPHIEHSTWIKRSETAAQHGATPDELRFLRNNRVELNAMSSDVFVQFIERKLRDHGVRKVVPDDWFLDQHARSVIVRKLLNEALDKLRAEAERKADAIALPDDLRRQVREALRYEPDLPWDLAVADIAQQALRSSEGGARE